MSEVRLSKFVWYVAVLALAVTGCAGQVTPTETVSPEPTTAPTDAPEPSPTDAPAVAEYEPVFEEADCPFDVPNGRTVECGYLVVPEDRSNPDSPNVRLAVAIYRSNTDSPSPTPLVYLEGGPGGNALAAMALNFEAAYARFLEYGDFIVFDQRGTGYSEPSLNCPEIDEVSLENLDEDIEPDEALAMIDEALLACHDRLVEEGVNLSAYNSAENAADLNDLRIALGYEEWNLYGVSYGSRLAMTTMREHPEGIRSVILDSTFPPEVDLFVATPSNFWRAATTLFDNCAADEACNAAFPDLEGTFRDLVARMNDEPVMLQVTQPLSGETYDQLVTGDGMTGFLFAMLYKASVIPLLPHIIDQAANGDFGIVEVLLGAQLVNMDYVSRGMQYSVLCHDEAVFSDPDEVATAADFDPLAEGLFSDSFLFGPHYTTTCQIWDAGEADPVENEPVVSDIPTLILAGEYDPITPPAWGQMVAGNLSNSAFYVFPNTGHGMLGSTSHCPMNVMLAFLADPTTAPDGSCIDEMEMQFSVPTDLANVRLVPVTVDEFGIIAVAPENWQRNDPEYWSSPLEKYELVIKQVPEGELDSFIARLLQSDPVDEIEVNGRVWALYDVLFEDAGVAGNLATTPAESGYYAVLLIGPEGQEADLYEYVLLPILEAFDIDESLIPDAVEDSEDTGESSGGAITLVPFTDEEMGLTGLVPEGWTKAGPGTHARSASSSDLATLIQKSYAGSTVDELLDLLLPVLGIEELPESVGSVETETFTWDLYVVEIDVSGVGMVKVDIALTELDGTPYLVLLQVLADEYDALHEAVFMPVLEALSPIE